MTDRLFWGLIGLLYDGKRGLLLGAMGGVLGVLLSAYLKSVDRRKVMNKETGEWTVEERPHGRFR